MLNSIRKSIFIYIFSNFLGYDIKTKMTEKDELDLKHNPWNVTNIDEFLYFCCPECDNKTQSRALFINHAYLHHPRVNNHFLLIIFFVKSNFYFYFLGKRSIASDR